PLCSLPLQPSRPTPHLHSFPTRRSSDLSRAQSRADANSYPCSRRFPYGSVSTTIVRMPIRSKSARRGKERYSSPRFSTASRIRRSEEHTSELQSRGHLVCRLLLEKKNKN